MDNRESFSDHKYISFSGGSFEPRNTELRNLNKANWKLFRESLDMVEWPVIDEDFRLEELAERFEKFGRFEKLERIMLWYLREKSYYKSIGISTCLYKGALD